MVLCYINSNSPSFAYVICGIVLATETYSNMPCKALITTFPLVL